MSSQPPPFLKWLLSCSMALAALHAWGGVTDSPTANRQRISQFNATQPPPDLHSLAVQSGIGRQSAKDRLKAGNAGTASGARPSYFRNETTCTYLTKPDVRADGGGLNRHALGSTVCYEGKTYACSEQGWSVRNACISGLPTAQEVEGSRFNAQVNELQNDESGGAGGRTAGRSSSNQNGGGPDSGGAPMLMGESPSAQRLREDQAAQRQREERLVQQQQQLQQQMLQGAGVSRGNAYGGGNGGAASNAQECASMRAQMPQMDRQLADAERMARGTTTNGSINPRYAPQIEQLRTLRSQAEAYLRSKGCN